MNADQLNMVPARDALQAAYTAVNGMQELPPILQIMASAILFHEVCAVLQLDPSEMLDKARRVRRIAIDHYSMEAHAIREYIKQELSK